MCSTGCLSGLIILLWLDFLAPLTRQGWTYVLRHRLLDGCRCRVPSADLIILRWLLFRLLRATGITSKRGACTNRIMGRSDSTSAFPRRGRSIVIIVISMQGLCRQRRHFFGPDRSTGIQLRRTCSSEFELMSAQEGTGALAGCCWDKPLQYAPA